MVVNIKPLTGLIVRDPKTMQPLPEEGKAVELNSYWQRRIKDKTAIVFSKENGGGIKPKPIEPKIEEEIEKSKFGRRKSE